MKRSDYLNQSELIKARHKYGLRTIEDVKRLTPHREVRKKVRGVNRVEYLFEKNLLSEMSSAIDRRLYEKEVMEYAS